MNNNQARDLFQLQSELVDTKVDMAVSKAIDRVVHEISGLRADMHDLRGDMDKQFSSLGQRVSSVEATLSHITQTQSKVTGKIIDYTFKAIWLIVASSILYILASSVKLLV